MVLLESSDPYVHKVTRVKGFSNRLSCYLITLILVKDLIAGQVFLTDILLPNHCNSSQGFCCWSLLYTDMVSDWSVP